jgi:hypothetical protein
MPNDRRAFRLRFRDGRSPNPRYMESIPKATLAWKRLAADRNTELRRIVTEIMQVTKLSRPVKIANALNLRGIKTNRGCQFTSTQVRRLLESN